HGGDSAALYRESDKTVFRPGLAASTGAAALAATADVAQSLERQLGRVAAEPPHEGRDVATTRCLEHWQPDCRSVMVAVEFALDRGKQVLVVTQPYERFRSGSYTRHIEQQREMTAMLTRRFGGDVRVRHVNLGETVDLEDPTLSFDHMHLTDAGNARIADALVDPVLDMAA